MLVEAAGPYIFGVHRQGADAGDLGQPRQERTTCSWCSC
jgi:hypothetical protein